MEGMIVKVIPAILDLRLLVWLFDLALVHVPSFGYFHCLLTVSYATMTYLAFRVGSGPLPSDQFLPIYSGFDMDKVNVPISKAHHHNL